MRKSSILQQSASKKFKSPFVKSAFHSPLTNKEPSRSCDAKTSVDSGSGAQKRSISDIMKLVSESPTGQDAAKRVRVEATTSESLYHAHSPACEHQVVKSSEVQLTPPPDIKEAGVSSSGAAEASKSARYFSVVWCKKSTKKHKKWEGDAVLIIKGRSATLKSLEGKELASTFGYKVKEVEAIEEGSLFSIGGKECEIQGVITTEEYLSGRCFSDGFVPSAPQDDSSPSSSAPPLSKNEICC